MSQIVTSRLFVPAALARPERVEGRRFGSWFDKPALSEPLILPPSLKLRRTAVAQSAEAGRQAQDERWVEGLTTSGGPGTSPAPNVRNRLVYAASRWIGGVLPMFQEE
jgi:hypothetical protein